MTNIRIFLLAAFCALLTTAGQVALKIGVSSPALGDALASGGALQFLLRAAVNPVIIVGLVLYGASAALWLLVLARADLSYALPLVSVGFVFSVLFAHFALGETVGPTRMAGIALITIGVACVAKS